MRPKHGLLKQRAGAGDDEMLALAFVSDEVPVLTGNPKPAKNYVTQDLAMFSALIDVQHALSRRGGHQPVGQNSATDG